MNPAPIVQVRDLRKDFVSGFLGRRHHTRAVDGVSFDLHRGRTLALVGESGSGKSTTARCLLGLENPSSGSIQLAGEEITHGSRSSRSERYRFLQMVFQDPHASLNPRRTVRETIAEPMYNYLGMTGSQREARARELLDLVHLLPSHLDRYPHELSGGQRQRVGIARALAVNPAALVLDEPTSSLDVSVRGRILQLLTEVQQELDLAYLFITHDLGVVHSVADEVMVMLRGRIVEDGTVSEVFRDPQDLYTQRLLSAIPIPRWADSRRRVA